MKRSSTHWIDRFSKTNDASIGYTKLRDRVSHLIDSIGSHWFGSDLFSYTLYPGITSNDLNSAGIGTKQFQAYKGLGICIGSVAGFGAAISTTEHLLSWTIIFIPIFAMIGFLLPEIIVLDRKKAQQQSVYLEFPRFLDLLHLYTASAAYHSLPAAMYQVASHMNGSFAKQLDQMLRVYRFVDLHVFLDEFEKQFPIPLARDLCTTLRVADQYGGSISEKIALLSDEAHKQQLRNAKKKGQRASATLLVPLMIFHFPVAIIIFLAPTALALRDMFGW